jgi:hypothetical protein
VQLCLDCLYWMDQQAEMRTLNQIEKCLKLILKRRFQELSDQEEQRWRQRAKRNWVTLGDRNTKFFHQLASHQKRKNYIDVITDQGRCHYKHQEKAQIIHRHFYNLMGTHHDQQQVSMELTSIFTPHQQILQNIQGLFTT